MIGCPMLIKKNQSYSETTYITEVGSSMRITQILSLQANIDKNHISGLLDTTELATERENHSSLYTHP